MQASRRAVSVYTSRPLNLTRGKLVAVAACALPQASLRSSSPSLLKATPTSALRRPLRRIASGPGSRAELLVSTAATCDRRLVRNEVQLIRHTAQLGNRGGLHFVHQIAAMDVHGGLTD